MKSAKILIICFSLIIFHTITTNTLYCAISAAERAALIALYNSTNGNSWTNNSGWKTPPLDADGFAMPDTENTWYGITVSGDRVTVIDLQYNQLSGSIPSELGNLSNIESLDLSLNNLSGSIPSSIGNLSNLIYLHLYVNKCNGSIPAEIGNCSNLKELILDNCKFSGAIPSALNTLSNLEELWLQFNEFTDLPDLSPISSLVLLMIRYNRFTFEDIESNIGVPSSQFLYSPQAKVGSTQNITKNAGQSHTFSVTVGGTANQYQWYKSASLIAGATGSSYTISSLVLGDAGSYTCQITNTIATALTLESNPINLTVLAASMHANFSADTLGGVMPHSIQFTDNSSGDITSRLWNFGDGETSPNTNPLHVYEESGIYDVSLTVNSATSSDTETKENYILVIPYSPVPHINPLFVDDFEDGNTDGWSLKNPAQWTVDTDSGSLALQINTSDYTNDPNNGLGEYALIDGFTLNDFTLTFDVRSTDLLSQNTIADYCVLFGYQNNDNYGYMMFNASSNSTGLNQMDTGCRTQLDIRYGNWVPDNAYHTIQITRIEDKMWFWQDSTIVMYADSVAGEGKVGFGSYNDAAIFDNVMLCVDDPPVANFEADTTRGTAPFTVQFTNNSTGFYTEWLWSFGDGETSTEQNPEHTYTTADTYDVSLTVTGIGGSDTETKVDYITVLNPTGIQEQYVGLITECLLYPNFPNPFNPETTIRFALPETAKLNLSVFDINGKLIETIYTGIKEAGIHTVTWNPTHLPSGTYFIRMLSKNNVQIQKCLFMK